MTDKLSQRYRDLGSPEPPAQLDRAILGAARRAVAKRRWPYAAAAGVVIVLAAGVVLHMEQEQPGVETIGAQAPAREAEEPASPPSAASAAPAAKPAPRFVPEPPARAASRPAAPMAAQSRLAETPQQWLERIARLRAAGKDDEAEKELVRFRERYPDYRIPDAMAKRVEKQAPAR
jgi:hypothetical protein